MEALRPLFLESVLPCWVIFGLLVVATLIAFFVHGWAAAFAPVLLLAATVIEVLGLLKFGTGMLWWLEGADFRSVGGVLKLLLFALAVTMQVGSIYIFGKNVAEDDFGDLSIWKPVISLLIAVAAAAVVIVVLTLFRIPQQWVFPVGGIVFLILVLIRVWDSMQDNCSVLGGFGGVLFTLFVLVWGVGTVAAIAMFVVSLFKALTTAIVVTVFVAAFVLLMVTGVLDGLFVSGGRGGVNFHHDPDEERRKAEMEQEEAQKKDDARNAAREKRNEEERYRRWLYDLHNRG